MFQKGTSTTMFTASLFTIARTWKLPKCPLTDEWIKKHVVPIYSGILLSQKKNEWNNTIAEPWMYLEIVLQSEVKSERERQIFVNWLYMESRGADELLSKAEMESQM